MDIKILFQALNKPWLIEPSYAQIYAARVDALIQSGVWDDGEDEEVKEFAWVVDAAGKKIGDMADAKENGVAVINLQGAVMKYDYCGAAGTQTLIKAIQQANDNPAIIAMVLQIDSPGGSVDGTEQMATVIKQSAKPIVAYVDGMMASAAMWMGSSSNYTIASSSTDIIGSIGTMASFRDFSGYYEKAGIKTHEIYATASTDKNSGYREALKGNYDNMRSDMLDPINNSFISAIKANRPGVDASVLNGAIYTAPVAKKKGLIDSIGTFSTAVNKAIQLGKQQKTNQMNFQNQFSKIIALVPAGEHFNAEAIVNEGIYLTAGHLAAVEAALNRSVKQEQDLLTLTGTLQDQLTTATTALTATQSQLTEANTKVTGLETQVEALKKAPAADFGNTTKKGTDNLAGPGGKTVQLTTVDKLKRQQKAAGY